MLQNVTQTLLLYWALFSYPLSVQKALITVFLVKYAYKSIPNNKTPGNDSLSKKFYKTFWDEIKDIFLDSLKEAKWIGSLSVSQDKL